MSVLSNAMVGRGSSGGATGVERSVRLRSAASASLSKSFTPDRQTFTISLWCKKSAMNAFMSLVGFSNTYTLAQWGTTGSGSDILQFYGDNGAMSYVMSGVHRDPTSWMHIVMVANTTHATSTERFKVYINGTQVTAWSTSTAPAQNANLIPSGATIYFGQRGGSPTGYFDGYLTEVYFVDGQALTPSSFGQADSNGIWVPKDYTGTYGNNGFYLNFRDVSGLSPILVSHSGAGAVSGGDYSGYPASSAIDGNTGTLWQSSQSGAGVNGSAYIGETWGSNQSIRYVRILCTTNPTLNNQPSSILIQTWDGSSWTTRITGTYNLSGDQTWDFGSTLSIKGYRFFANAGTAGGNWVVNEIYAYSALGLGGDSSGQGNWWNTNNISLTAGVTYDSMYDYPVNAASGTQPVGNYATLNVLDPLLNSPTVSEGGLKFAGPSAQSWIKATIPIPTSGKWYWEVQPATTSSGTEAMACGIATDAAAIGTAPYGLSGTYWYYSNNGNKSVNGGASSAYGTGYSATTDVIGFLFDADAGTITAYLNNSSQGTLASSLSGVFWPAVADTGSTYANSWYLNFGQRPFAYTPPTGFKALCTANLPSDAVVTSGSFAGNASADGPVVYLKGNPTALTINGNAVTFGTHADKLATGFKLRTNSASYNASGSNTFTATAGDKFANNNRAQGNP